MCVTMNFVRVENLGRVALHVFREVENHLLRVRIAVERIPSAAVPTAGTHPQRCGLRQARHGQHGYRVRETVHCIGTGPLFVGLQYFCGCDVNVAGLLIVTLRR